MCVIIDRLAGVSIPTAMIERACDINKHGFGVSWAQGRKLYYEYSSKIPNDPKEVCDLLQKLGDRRVFLHLRHATVGDTSKENLHPFPLLSKKKHGLDIAMMHNGTLYDWTPPKDSTQSDTAFFTERLLRPLALRINKFAGTHVLDDPIFRRVLSKEVGGISVVLLFDSLGNVIGCNQERGQKFEGWWASNSYSFDNNHIRSSHRVTHQSWNYGTTGRDDDEDDNQNLPWIAQRSKQLNSGVYTTWEDDLSGKMAKANQELSQFNRTMQGKPVSVADATRVKYEIEKVGEILNKAIYRSNSIMAANATTLRELKVLKTPFVTAAGLQNLDDVARLTEENIIEICKEYPHAVGRLIVDLVVERQHMKQKNGMQAKTIIDLTKDKKSGTEA